MRSHQPLRHGTQRGRLLRVLALALLAIAIVCVTVYPVASLGMYVYVSHLYDSGLPRTRAALDGRLWFMSSREVPDSDLPHGFVGDPSLEKPHVLVRYRRLGVPLHVVYESNGQDVRMILPSHE